MILIESKGGATLDFWITIKELKKFSCLTFAKEVLLFQG